MPKIHSIETLGALDGPGLRTVIFFQGCPMRCAYCHNADMLDFGGGEEKTVRELVGFCLRYKNYYGLSGGVTLSGGEPLAQAGEALKLIRALKKEGIHTALDTSGAVFAPEVLKEADLVILDIKHADPAEFFKLTGHLADQTFQTLEFLKKTGKKFWVRQVIAGGITDSEEQVRALKSLAAGAEKIELLPYHTMGAHKWRESGLEYPLKGVLPTSPETIERLKKFL